MVVYNPMIPVDRSNCSSFGIFIFTIAIKLYLLARNIGDSLYKQKLIEIITVRTLNYEIHLRRIPHAKFTECNSEKSSA